jgi:murein DD-endopeptidase MepM/ murein hydrolase activator NlpD
LILFAGTANADHLRSYGVVHTIHRGETLDRIARTYGVKVEAIVRVNHIADPHRIVTGKRLLIPEGSNTSPPPSRRVTALASVPSKSTALRVDFIWPLEGPVTSMFGRRRGRRHHEGIDIDSTTGARIRAAGDGVVTYSGWGPKGYGRTVIVEHPNGLRSVYAHNLKNLVKKGQGVRQGEPIALVGSSGWATGSHLHFEVRNGKSPKNPMVYLP